MNRTVIKERLEILKSVLVCVALVTVIASSCSTQKASNDVLSRIVQLQAVVQEVAETCGYEPNETESQSIDDESYDNWK